MTRFIRNIFFSALLIGTISCAVKVEDTSNDKNQRYLEKWIGTNYPDAIQSPLGTYILSETPSTVADAAKVEEDGWVVVDFTSKKLDGTVQNTTLLEIAEKYLPSKNRKDYYYPQIFITSTGAIMAGLNDVLLGMEVGESKTVLIPSWLMSYKQHNTAEEYTKETTEYGNTIYELKIVDFYKDINDRDTELMLEHVADFALTIADTVETGFFYYTLEPGDEPTPPEEGENPEEGEPEQEKADSSIYINYIGTFLNYNSDKELVKKTFDTSIENVAKDFGLYKSSNTYKQKLITWGENFSETKMEDNAVISGFSKTLWQLKEKGDKKGVGVFWSQLGYGATGATDAIPAYSPLIFTIEVADKPTQ